MKVDKYIVGKEVEVDATRFLAMLHSHVNSRDFPL